jgi:hypothetical protein
MEVRPPVPSAGPGWRGCRTRDCGRGLGGSNKYSSDPWASRQSWSSNAFRIAFNHVAGMDPEADNLETRAVSEDQMWFAEFRS